MKIQAAAPTDTCTAAVTGLFATVSRALRAEPPPLCAGPSVAVSRPQLQALDHPNPPTGARETPLSLLATSPCGETCAGATAPLAYPLCIIPTGPAVPAFSATDRLDAPGARLRHRAQIGRRCVGAENKPWNVGIGGLLAEQHRFLCVPHPTAACAPPPAPATSTVRHAARRARASLRPGRRCPLSALQTDWTRPAPGYGIERRSEGGV